ncbi:uncharacterized protein Fot_24456 [Forsythia ovata]|uniref:Uncharacterized protein n=1 Tax=Forsythia ovata TaxID=205694 RepID=A0ABD1U7B9_9LAMI
MVKSKSQYINIELEIGINSKRSKRKTSTSGNRMKRSKHSEENFEERENVRNKIVEKFTDILARTDKSHKAPCEEKMVMDPCPFVRLIVENLALKILVASKSARSVVYPSSSSCFCKIKFNNFSLQTALVPYILLQNTQFSEGSPQTLAASFHLGKSDLDRLIGKLSLFATSKKLEH